MKALAIVTDHHESPACQWQFDKLMAAIAYDLDLSVVFLNQGTQQLIHHKMWRSLDLYGIDQVYYHSNNKFDTESTTVQVQPISTTDLALLIRQADMVL